MSDVLAAWWRDNAVVFLLGSVLWSLAGAAAVAFWRPPVERQRFCEATVAGWLVWLVLAALPGRGASEAPLERLAPAADPLVPASASRLVATPLPVEAAQGVATSLLDLCGLCLAGGALLACLWLLFAWLLLGRLLRRAVPAPARVGELLATLRAPRGVRVVVSDLAWRPFCCGAIRPCIVLPRAMLATPALGEARTLRAVLLHELAHVTRGDLRGRLLFALAMPLAWWNPLFWRLRREAHLAAELLADELAATESTDRPGYARSLLDLAELLPRAREARVAALGTFGPPTHFSQRMTMLLRRKTPLATRSSRRTSLSRAATALAASALASLAWTAPRLGAQAEPEKPAAPANGSGQAPVAPKSQESLRYEMRVHYAEEKDLGTIVTRLADRGLTIEKLDVEANDKRGRRTAVLAVAMPDLGLLREVGALVEPAVVSVLVPLRREAAPGARRAAVDPRAPRVRFHFEQAEVRKVVGAIAKISGSDIRVAEGVEGAVTIRLVDLPWREALDITARQVGAVVAEGERGVLLVEKAPAAPRR